VRHKLREEQQLAVVNSEDHHLQLEDKIKGHQDKAVLHQASNKIEVHLLDIHKELVVSPAKDNLQMDHHLACKTEALHHKVILVLLHKVRDLHLKVSSHRTAVVN
jgi:hypothetical protein